MDHCNQGLITRLRESSRPGQGVRDLVDSGLPVDAKRLGISAIEVGISATESLTSVW